MENIDTNDAFFVPDVSEDSVDIYDDLEMEFGSNLEKSSPNSKQLKESMDLYEELVTEEQQSKESTHNELKSRFLAAQNQIQELRRRLEQMEMRNTGLNTENYRLKKNISALLRTARQEVTRKDAEIQRLNQRPGKGHYHQSRINNMQDHSSFNQQTPGSSMSRLPPPPASSYHPPPPASSYHPPPPASSFHPPPPASSYHPPPPASSYHPPPPDSSYHPPPPASSFHPPRPASSHSPPPPPSSPPPPAPPPPPPLPSSPPREDHPPNVRTQPTRKDSEASGSCIETRASKASSHTHSKSSSRGDRQVADKQTERPVHKSNTSSSTRHSDSDKHKSKHRQKRHQTQKISESTDRRHKTGSDASEKNKSHKTDNDTERRYESRSCKTRNYQSGEEHHRSERAKSPPPDILHNAGSSEEKRSRERRQDKLKMTTSDSDHGSHSSKEGYSRDHTKIKTKDGHCRSSDSKDRKKSSSNQPTESYSESSRERDGAKHSKNHQRKKEKREINRRHMRSPVSETSRKHANRASKESDHAKVDVHSKETSVKTNTALKRLSGEPSTVEKISVEENSPNRKLCFMETLNLTISPIKKVVLPFDSSQDDLSSVENVLESRPDDECSQPDVDDMCVIDEVDCSLLEADSENDEERPSELEKTLCSEKAQKECDEDVQEQDKIQRDGHTADKLLKDNLVETSAVLSQPLDTVENQTTACLTPELPESSSQKAMDEDIANDHEDRTKLPSDIQVDGSKQVEAADCQNKRNSPQKLNRRSSIDQSVTKSVVLDSSVELSENVAPQNLSLDSDAVTSDGRETPVAEDDTAEAKPRSLKISPSTVPTDCRQPLTPPALSSSPHKKDACSLQDGAKDADAVSSTISLESLPQEGLSLPEAIYVLTRTNEDTSDSCSVTAESSSSTNCIGVSKVSSTTEEPAPPEKYSDLTFTPKKSFSPGQSHEGNGELSSSMPLLHDEDSMMRTLNNLKRIPDAISPLRSPIRMERLKRNHLLVQSKPGHVKSLQKDFSSSAADVNSKTLDVNKENKYPGSPSKHEPQNMDNVSELPSRLSDTELEEGEILSESDEATVVSPVPATKRAKLVRPVRNKPSPKSVLKNETTETAEASTPSPTSKSRYKTVCPAGTKTSFSTIEEVMDTFKLVRAKIRKKYMKLHKTFPKKSFYGVMDNFQESFLEFVDGANFGQICRQAGELKSQLKTLVVSVFSKVANNGIVKRIFEQQAVDLKQKLWDFVDGQVDYLFKDIHTTLKNLYKPARAEGKKASGNEKVSTQPAVKKPHCQPKPVQSPPASLSRINPCAVAPYKTGLGSRGKDIRMTHAEKEGNVDPRSPKKPTVVDFLPPKIPSTPEKNHMTSLVVSQNGSLFDKTDFELLTEQQASSLTFNLVRDSQMGEIFKCLLQGSDLLESGGITADNTTWSLGTPRKDGERLINITTPSKFDSPSKLLSPAKFDTPSKLIATWSSISPRKMSSPRSKDHIPLNPALFDESCMLELPESRTTLASQRCYSILAEDLAVSLTIPSPLKSDSHLSFLQPSSMAIMSTPDSVISAHISEDALLDGEDASEQDIHLALDTDNSSCGSGSSMGSEAPAVSFVFKPDVPMQALVMEQSHDHFILKIRQASPGANVTLTPDDSASQTLIEEEQQCGEHDVEPQESQENAVLLEDSQKASPCNSSTSENSTTVSGEHSGMLEDAADPDTHLSKHESLTLTKDLSRKKESTQQSTSDGSFSEASLSGCPRTRSKTTPSKNGLHNVAQSPNNQAATIGSVTSPAYHKEKDVAAQQSPLKSPSSPHPAKTSETTESSKVSPLHMSDSDRTEMEASESERSFTAALNASSTPEKDQKQKEGRKRKKHQEKSKVKRPRNEKVIESEKDGCESKSSPSGLSPSSLSAKNVIKKKGTVVMAWTRDEDRTILVDLKTNGASRETFSALSEKLDKPSAQIAQRFYQLMKLFKKQGKMDT